MFERGKRYHRRTEIHAKYGGQEQRGISTPKDHPYVFLFASEVGEDFGYSDGWIDPERRTLFRYSGEGQRGDMEMTHGNRAIKDHAKNDTQLHLFERVAHGYYQYVGQFEYLGYDVQDRGVDGDGSSRRAIHFILKRVDD